MTEKTCKHCGGQLDNGYVSAAPREDTNYTTLNPSGKYDATMLMATACLSCGHVELSVDPENLRKLVGK